MKSRRGKPDRLFYNRRGIKLTRVMRKVVTITEVRIITDMKRRVFWRCRELGTSMRAVCKENGFNYESVMHSLGRPRIYLETLEKLDDALNMAEVNGWDRPFPPLPPLRDRETLSTAFNRWLDEKYGVE